jgi:hypothetical protein
MAVVGNRLQRANWERIVEQMVEDSGGRAPAGVQVEERTLDGDDAGEVERWLAELALARKRATNAEALGVGDAPTADRQESAP